MQGAPPKGSRLVCLVCLDILLLTLADADGQHTRSSYSPVVDETMFDRPFLQSAFVRGYICANTWPNLC